MEGGGGKALPSLFFGRYSQEIALFPFPPPPSFCSWHHWLFHLAAASSVLPFPSSFPFCHLILRIGGRGSFLGIVDSSSPSVDDTVGLYSSPPERPPPPPPPCSVGCLSRLRLRPPLLPSFVGGSRNPIPLGGEERGEEKGEDPTHTQRRTRRRRSSTLSSRSPFPPLFRRTFNHHSKGPLIERQLPWRIGEKFYNSLAELGEARFKTALISPPPSREKEERPLHCPRPPLARHGGGGGGGGGAKEGVSSLVGEEWDYEKRRRHVVEQGGKGGEEEAPPSCLFNFGPQGHLLSSGKQSGAGGDLI